MIKLNLKDNYFDYLANNPGCKVVVYGAGNEARKNYKYIEPVDFFCDQKAKEIGTIQNVPCLLPEELLKIDNEIVILICIRKKEIVESVCSMLNKLEVKAEVFSFFENAAFSEFDVSSYKRRLNLKAKLKIHIVYKADSWIFGKFVFKLQEELTKMGHEINVSEEEDLTADINHYVSYGQLTSFYGRSNTIRTTMITHIDCLFKKDLIKYQAENKAVGICMSSDTLNKLSLWGVPRDRLCYINPAQDGDIRPRKIVLGITNRCYHEMDLRKKDNLILKVCEHLNPRFFKLKIMGAGWEEIVDNLRKLEFEVDYYAEFDRDIYVKLMPSLDYWIYYGFDEGAMGYLDALAAGVKTIATPQGYHLDTKYGLTFPCTTIDDFIEVLQRIQNEKKIITDAVKDWTWENYARKHLEVWEYLAGTKPLRELYLHQSEYMDGIFSLLVQDISLL